MTRSKVPALNMIQCVFHGCELCVVVAAELIICLTVSTHSVSFCPCLELNSAHNSQWLVSRWKGRGRKEVGVEKDRNISPLCSECERGSSNEGLPIQAHSSVLHDATHLQSPGAFVLLLTAAVIPHSV